MTTSQKDALWVASDNAAYSAYCQAVYDALVAIGLTQTSDTGQTSAAPVSVSFPGANTYNVNWIFRFNDSMQASAPIYFKIELGRGTGTANFLGKLTVGTGSNGTGTITNPVLNAAAAGATSWSPSATNPSRFDACYNAATGCCWLAFETNNNQIPGGFIISRSLDSGGTPSADGWMAIWQTSGSTTTFASLEVGTATIRAPVGVFPYPYLPTQGQTIMPNVYNNTMYIYAPQLQVGSTVKQFGGFYGSAKVMVPSSNLSITQFGVTRTYRQVAGYQQFGSNWDYGQRSGVGSVLIWE